MYRDSKVTEYELKEILNDGMRDLDVQILTNKSELTVILLNYQPWA